MDERHFDVELTRDRAFAFTARFDSADLGELRIDEPVPLGQGDGPNASRVLGAAIGHCLGASLLFCLGKARVDVSDLTVRVHGTVTRNDAGRLRITDLRVTLHPTVRAGERERLGRCVSLFEDFCIVTSSVRNGIAVHVEVEPADAAVEAPARGEPS
jgi:organic hydroperoxide reductase OsmC/OhrA